MARRTRGQFEFTVVELGVLAVSFTVTSCLVFLLGLYVGRDLSAEHAPVDERVARIPVADHPPQLPARVDLPGEAETATEPGGQPAKAPAPAPTPEAAAMREPSRAVKAAAQEAGRPPAQPEQETPEPAAQRYTRPVAPVPDQRAATGRPDPVLETPLEAEPPAGHAMAYTVQVLATRNRREADSLVADLKRRGFGAFVAPVEDGGGQWYRVRIGRYDSQDSARAMAERCREQLGIGQAFVSPYRPSAP
jgi:cell division septation protein DedD